MIVMIMIVVVVIFLLVKLERRLIPVVIVVVGSTALGGQTALVIAETPCTGIGWRSAPGVLFVSFAAVSPLNFVHCR